MNTLSFVFYVCAGVLLGAGWMVITSSHPVRAVLSLVLAFVAAAGLWLTLEAEFLAVSLVLVYVGAVMVLFLFVIMMLDVREQGTVSWRGAGAWWVVLGLVALCWHVRDVFSPFVYPLPVRDPDFSHIRSVGERLFTAYLPEFELTGVLLLAAVVAAVGLTYRGPVRRKTQHVAEQVRTRASDRVRLVSMRPGQLGEPVSRAVLLPHAAEHDES